MATLQQKIKDYLLERSNGVIKLHQTDCDFLINLVIKDHDRPTEGVAKLYRYNLQLQTYELLFARPASDESIKAAIVQAVKDEPVFNFYMWECYNSAHEYEGKIYTTNTNLF